MKLSHAIPVLALCGAIAYAAPVVTLTGTINSMDSSRANLILHTNGTSKVIVLPRTVKVHLGSASGRTLTLANLTQGTRVMIDAHKTATGQLNADTVVVMTSGAVTADTDMNPSPGSTANNSVAPAVLPSANAASATAVRNVKNGVPVVEVRVHGRTVMRLRGGGGFTQAADVTRRLNAMPDLKASDITAGRSGGRWAVLARGTTLIAADAGNARYNHTSTQRLAAMWAANLRAQMGTS